MRKGHIVKQKIMDGLKQKMKENNLIVLTDTTTLSVEEITRLRRELSKTGASYTVAKNRLFMRVAEDLGIFFPERLTGPTGFLFAKDAPLSCKVLLDFIKKEKKPAIKFGFLAQKRIDKAQIEHIALLPAREVLLSQVISQIQAPIRGLVQALAEIPRKLLYVLNAIKEKKNA